MKNKILQLLPNEHPWRETLHVLESVDSTNALAHTMAKDGAPHGTVILAKTQTAGKGRMGRSFHSPAHMGVYMTVILRPDCLPTELMHLTCATAVAMCDAVEAAAGFRPQIKWANDLVVGTKKLGGILTELSLTQGRVCYALIGIGINCCGNAQDFPTELQNMVTTVEAAGNATSTEALAAAMILELEKLSRSFLCCKAECLQRYRANCITLGKQISIVSGGEISHATALDVDADGGLIVADAQGLRRTVNFGEVSVRGMYGYIN